MYMIQKQRFPMQNGDRLMDIMINQVQLVFRIGVVSRFKVTVGVCLLHRDEFLF